MFDTTMSGKADLTIEFVDCYGRPPRDSAEIVIKHTRCDESRRISAETDAPIVLRNLDISDGGVYRILIHPTRHSPESHLVKLSQGQNALQIALTVIPAAVCQVLFPAYDKLSADLRKALEASDTVDGSFGRTGAVLYEGLASTQRAGLLNIYCKMASTQLLNRRSVFSYIGSFWRLSGDRLLAVAANELRAETVKAIPEMLFHQIAGDMHPPPFPEVVESGSYKTYEAFGNLHLTFFSDPTTGIEFVEADIDNAQGIQHLAHLIRHTSTKGATHPYDIHQILLYHQKLDPGYRLQV